jgi:RHS repeat-associated protein
MKLTLRIRQGTSAIAILLVPSLSLAGVPLAIAQVPPPPAALPFTSAPVAVNRAIPQVKTPPLRPSFSFRPTAAEISKARVLEEPLVPTGPTFGAENARLAGALLRYLDRNATEHIGDFEGFLAEYPASAWRTSLLSNLGLVAHDSGFVTKALGFHEQAWTLGKDSSEPRVRALADRSASELAWLMANLGHQDALERLLDEVKGRDFSGSAAERMNMARQALLLMQTRPSDAFRCGPIALARVLQALGHPADDRIAHSPATARGTSLDQVRRLAVSAGVSLLSAKRINPEAALPVPSVVHFRTGHFGAVVAHEGDRYLVSDPVFDGERWLSKKALQEEMSGYVLATTVADGFEPVDDDEAGTIWGKSCPSQPDPTQQNCEDPSGGGGGCPSGRCEPGMAQYTFLTLLAALRVRDTPLAYTPPRGPSVNLTLTYNQRDIFQPAVFTYANVGPKWTFDAISYVEDDAAGGVQTVRLYQRGGGMEVFPSMPAGASQSAPDFRHRTILKRLDANTYQRVSPDGSVATYGQPDGVGAFPRKIFLTKETDPQGNSLSFIYSDSLQLEAIADALGQVTTFAYADGASRRITGITDPFGRTATLAYDASGRLSSITDALGLTSSFTYGTSDFITSMTTPYGTTEFSTGSDGSRNWIEAKDPLDARERLEYVRIHDGSIGQNQLPTAEVPNGFELYNANFDAALTLFWDKRAMSLAPGDLASAEVKHWLENPVTHQPRGIIRAHKKALEGRVWYAYEGQSTSHGNDGRMTRMGRILDDGSSQFWEYSYNQRGMVCSVKDPEGRETRYTYGADLGTGTHTPDNPCASGTSIDLLEVKQKNPAVASGWDVVETRTYNPANVGPQHVPLTIKDGALQETTYTYNASGQVTTVTTPLRPAFPSEQRTTTYTYLGPYLQSVVAPGGVTSAYTYDGYGRRRTVTDNDGDTTTYDYDIMDRPTRTTYPDTTYEETTYDRLDRRGSRDRLGRWTETLHDPLRRVVSTRDPANRVVTQEWCTCGSLNRIVDPNGNATSWERDVLGRVTKEVRIDGSFQRFEYEATASRLKQKTDALGQIVQYTYWKDDRLKDTTYPNAQKPTPSVTRSYTIPANGSVPAHADPHGRLRSIADGTGTTTFSYVPFSIAPVVSLGAGRIASIDGPLLPPNDDIIAYTSYDQLGRPLTRTYRGTSMTWAYDQQGRLTSQVDSGIAGSFSYAYVGNTPRLGTLTYPNGQTSIYSYFGNAEDRRLSNIAHKGPTANSLEDFDYSYDDVGNITAWGRGLDGARPQRYQLEYDQANQLSRATLKNFQNIDILKRYRYSYDPAGNRIAEQIDNSVASSTYDSRNRIVSQQPGGLELFRGSTNEPTRVTIQNKPATVDHKSQFTGAAETLSGTPTDVVVKAEDYAGNIAQKTYRVTQTGSTRSFGHDVNGNLSSKTEGGVTTTYEWDAENRLVAVKQGATTIASFTYDGQGRRRTKFASGITSTYIWANEQLLEERSSFLADRRYIDAPGVDAHLASLENGNPTYLLADHLGSIVRSTNAAGTAVLTRTYDPWGSLLQGGSTSGYAFTGREWDSETSLYYYRARQYSPALGRFLSEDPAGLSVGMNLYEYVRNSPGTLTDPLGLCPECCTKCYSEAWELRGASTGIGASFLKWGVGATVTYGFLQCNSNTVWRSVKINCSYGGGLYAGFGANVGTTGNAKPAVEGVLCKENLYAFSYREKFLSFGPFSGNAPPAKKGLPTSMSLGPSMGFGFGYIDCLVEPL